MKTNIIQSIENKKAKSAWARGVKTYALELLDNLESDEVTLDALLNGARTWSEYSYGGSACIYDSEIAVRLCAASELHKKRGGELPPSKRETWLDCQARALSQASRMILALA